MKDFQERVFVEGMAHGMCQKFQDKWENPDLATLCRFFHEGQDFCIEHEFPSKELVMECADKIGQYGIFAVDGQSVNQTNIVSLYDSKVNVLTNIITDITARHKSTIELSVCGNVMCFVTLRDNATLMVVHKDPESRIVVSYYGGTIRGKEFINKVIVKNK